VDLLIISVQLAFFAVFGAVVVRYARDRRPVNRDLVLVFGCVAMLFVSNLITQFAPDAPALLRRAGSFFLLAQPYLTLRLASHVTRVPRWVGYGALAWAVLSVVLIVPGITGNTPVILFVVGYFVVVQVTAAGLLARAAGERFGYARIRLRVAAAATLIFAAAILVVGAAAASGQADPSVTFLARILSLVAGLGYLAAFLPPQSLRRLQQRAAAFELGQSLIAAPVDGDPDALWTTLARTSRHATGGSSATVALGEPPEVRATDGEPQLDDPVDGKTDRLSVPIALDDAVLGTLTVAVDRGSLFLEDDRVLLRLLAEQAARSAERQQVLRERVALRTELQDASERLAVSRAELESEARFRVALEAHPNLLLVIEPTGLVGYANQRALETLGYTSSEIRRRRLGDLLSGTIASAPDTRTTTAEVRRSDGTVLPVDLAMSEFHWDEATYSIVVLTDISERLETERLRDTFIGMLSHELRTPVTSIYGGSQVLLDRGDRLSPEVTHELIGDIASEAERLHRLIENLLVLARVERGQELAGGEPILLQRLLPTIIERERILWPATRITMSVPSGLPTVQGHDGYVAQVIRNLVSNAGKYAGAGSSVEIVAERRDDAVAVRVLDDGTGLSEGDAGRLFDLYYRAPSAAGRAPGAGIGLYVCQRIIMALGGRIWAAGRPEGGAEFGFELPVYTAEDDQFPVEDDEAGLAAIS
jgi:PAS domain S-box-containing protein